MTPPIGAAQILQARMAGNKPADLVIISLVGPLAEANPVIQATGHAHDWRFCRGLKVCVFGKVGTPNRQVAIAIGSQFPAWLGVWDVESREGADVIAHLKDAAMDKRDFELSDWTAMFWPWSQWENKRFQGVL